MISRARSWDLREQSPHLREAGAQLWVTDLDGAHRVLELGQDEVRAGDRRQGRLQEAARALRGMSRARRGNEPGGSPRAARSRSTCAAHARRRSGPARTARARAARRWLDRAARMPPRGPPGDGQLLGRARDLGEHFLAGRGRVVWHRRETTLWSYAVDPLGSRPRAYMLGEAGATSATDSRDEGDRPGAVSRRAGPPPHRGHRDGGSGPGRAGGDGRRIRLPRSRCIRPSSSFVPPRPRPPGPGSGRRATSA